MDYDFHKEKLYLTLSNGNILRYNLSVSETDTGELIATLESPATILYTASMGNTLGSITVDWLDDTIYWIENENSARKVMYQKNV